MKKRKHVLSDSDGEEGAGPISLQPGDRFRVFFSARPHRMESIRFKEATAMRNYYQPNYEKQPDRTQPPFSPSRWEERWFSVEGDLDDFIFYDPSGVPSGSISER